MTQEAIAAAHAHMDAVNTADTQQISQTQNFPFVHLWPDGRCEIAMKPEDLPEVDRKVLGNEWHHTDLDSTDVITAGPDAVAMRVTFTRRREDGSSMGSYEAVWVATRINGHWGIQFRNGTLSLD